MILDGVNQTLKAVLAGAITTTNPTYWVSWTALNSTSLDQTDGQGGALNGVTAVNLLAGATTRQFKVNSLAIFNTDTVSVTVTVSVDDTGADRQVYQAILAPGESLHYLDGVWTSNDAQGRVFRETSNSGDIQIFRGAGSYTWRKPVAINPKTVQVYLVGAGGGGGGSGMAGTGAPRQGGTGGGGGAFSSKIFTASELPETVPVTIGAGGAGGAGTSSSAVNGSPGTTGGHSSFDGYIYAYGGGGGGGGSSTTAGFNTSRSGGSGGGVGASGAVGGSTNNPGGGPGETTISVNPSGGQGAHSNNGGGAYDCERGGSAGGNYVSSNGPAPGTSTLFGAGGGGAGAGVAATVPYAGRNGGASRSFLSTNGTGGLGALGLPVPGGDGRGGSVFYPGAGGGGGGSWADPTIGSGFRGGHGGAPGGGGGGGGAGTFSAAETGGNGGNGADGEVWVVSI